MNSYSENLHSSVVAALGAQEMNDKLLTAQLDASIFTLYYSEATEILTNEQFLLVEKLYKAKQQVNDQAVKNKNISDNTLLSAHEQKSYIEQSITNTTVSADNIQTAANAIIRLAGDIGSIFSIVNAADYGTQIFQQCLEAHNLINKTADYAEIISQLAMENSASIAEVAGSSIADKAKLTNDSVNSLLQAINTDLLNTAAKISADTEDKNNARLASQSNEGNIKCIKVKYEATKKAYETVNKNLNRDLRVEIPDPFIKSYSVSFDLYRPPFMPEDQNPNNPATEPADPVKSYNIMLVKDSKKSFFSIANAEELLSNPTQHVEVPVNYTKIKEREEEYDKAFKIAEEDYQLFIKAEEHEKNVIENSGDSSKVNEDKARKNTETAEEKYMRAAKKAAALKKEAIDMKIHKQIDFNTLVDSDGDPFVLGEKYVIFLLTVFSDNYKKEIDIQDDYLSAPSKAFSITHTLNPAQNFTFNPTDSPKLNFEVANSNELDVKQNKIEYRCMFLPYPDDLFTNKELNTLESEIQSMEEIQEQIILQSKMDTLYEEIKELNKKNSPLERNTDTANEKNEIPDFTIAMKKAVYEEVSARIQWYELENKIRKNRIEISHNIKNKNAFFFNVNLANNVSAGNYTVAVASAEMTPAFGAFHVVIDDSTTDNFGTPLIPGFRYIPVVLSCYNGPVAEKSSYTNVLSDWENTATFICPEIQDSSTY